MVDDLSNIIPRWEWRTFAPSLRSLRSRLPGAMGEPRASSEIYLMSQSTSQNIKVRDDQIDIKHLKKVDNHGFELWAPVFKGAVPLSSDGICRVFQEWDLASPSHGEAASLDQFLTKVVSLARGVNIVHVEKSRRSFSFAECMAEFAEVSFEGKRLETFSIESEDTGKIVAALAAIGLSGSMNISYPACLKRLLESA